MNLNEYQKRVLDTWISNTKDSDRIKYGLIGELGEIFEHLKKHARGDYGQGITSDEILKANLKKEIGDLSYYISQFCNDYKINWENILEENLKKLKDRQERNKIKGSGDSR